MLADELLDHGARPVRLTANPARETAQAAVAQPQFAAGERVVHATYGRGTVLATRLEGGRELVTVRFLQRGLVREIDAARGMLRPEKEPRRPLGDEPSPDGTPEP